MKVFTLLVPKRMDWPIRPLKPLIAKLVASLTISQLRGCAVRRTDQMEKRSPFGRGRVKQRKQSWHSRHISCADGRMRERQRGSEKGDAECGVALSQS